MAKQKFEELAPVEASSLTPAAEKRRPDPKPLQRAWGALGAATGSALLATIVGPMVASATGGFSLDGTTTTEDTATTNSEVAAIAGLVIPMNIALPAGYKIFVTLGTAVAGGYSVTGVGGKY